MILMICIQLLQERLPYNSVRMYVTMSKGIMGISGSNLLGWSSKCFSINECFLLPLCWNIVNLKFTATNQYQTIITRNTNWHYPDAFTLWEPLSKQLMHAGPDDDDHDDTMMMMILQMAEQKQKKNNHMHIVCPWRRYNTILLQSSNLTWLELKSILIKRTNSK